MKTQMKDIHCHPSSCLEWKRPPTGHLCELMEKHLLEASYDAHLHPPQEL